MKVLAGTKDHPHRDPLRHHLEHPAGVWGDDAGKVYAVGHHGLILRN